MELGDTLAAAEGRNEGELVATAEGTPLGRAPGAPLGEPPGDTLGAAEGVPIRRLLEIALGRAVVLFILLLDEGH